MLGVVAALCICAAIVGYISLNYLGKKVGQAIQTDPAQVAQVADKIADFDLPPGYDLAMSMSFVGYDVVIITPSGSSANATTIMLMQTAGLSGADPEQLQQQMQQAMQQQTGQSGPTVVVETRQETIRGQQVTVTISETQSQGFTLRQLMTFFEGKNGLVILMIQGPAQSWDEKVIEDFLQSIH